MVSFSGKDATAGAQAIMVDTRSQRALALWSCGVHHADSFPSADSWINGFLCHALLSLGALEFARLLPQKACVARGRLPDWPAMDSRFSVDPHCTRLGLRKLASHPRDQFAVGHPDVLQDLLECRHTAQRSDAKIS